MRMMAKRACWTAVWAKRRASGFRSIGRWKWRRFTGRATRGFTAKHFHEHLVQRSRVQLGLHLDEDLPAFEAACWSGPSGAGRIGASGRAGRLPGMMLHQDGSRHEWLGGQPALDLIVTLDDATGAILFGVSGRGGRHGLDVPGAGGGLRRAWPAAEPLHRSRQPLFSHAGSGRQGGPGQPDAGGAGARRIWASNISRPIRRRRADARSGCSTRLQDRLAKELALAGIDDDGGRQRLHPRCLYSRLTTRVSPSRPNRKARLSSRSRASIWTRSCASRRSARSATTIACRSTGSSCKSRPARCAPISSRRASRSANIPTEPTRSFTARDALAATTKRRSNQRNHGTEKGRLNPLGGRLWKCGQGKRLDHSPTGEQNQKKRTFDVLPKPAKLISYRQRCGSCREKRKIPEKRLYPRFSRSRSRSGQDCHWSALQKSALRDFAGLHGGRFAHVAPLL